MPPGPAAQPVWTGGGRGGGGPGGIPPGGTGSNNQKTTIMPTGAALLGEGGSMILPASHSIVGRGSGGTPGQDVRLHLGRLSGRDPATNLPSEIQGVSERIGTATREDTSLYTLFRPMAQGFASLNFRPQLTLHGYPNFERNPQMPRSMYRLDEQARPQVLTMRAYGAQSSSDSDWRYVQNPEQSRARGGTADGGILLAPPRFELSDYYGIGGDVMDVTDTTSGLATSHHVLHAPGVSAAFGLPTMGGGVQPGGSSTGYSGPTKPQITSIHTSTGTLDAVTLNYNSTGDEVVVEFGQTGAIQIPSGTTAQRPSNITPAAGMLRFNTSNGEAEIYDGTSWGALGGGSASGDITSSALTMQGPGLLGTSDTSSTAAIKVMSVLTPLRLAGTTLDIAPSGVDTTELADDSVTEAKIADGAITSDKIAADNQYHGRYNTEAAARTVANGDFYVELFYTARPDGDGLDEDPQSDAGVPALSYVERRLYFSDKFNADPTVSSDWTAYTTQPADDTSYADAKTALLAGLNDTDATANTRGTLPLSLKIERKVTSDLLLEDYPGAVLACSVRKISGAYTGDCMTVRRASDNTEQDIGFDASGNLDTAAIATFCGTSNGYVSKWYDQSGNSNDWVQTGASSQPQIYDGSQVLKVNTKPSIRFFNTPSYMQQGTQALPTSGGYAFAVMGVNPTATDRAFGVIGSNNAAVVAGLARDGNTGANVLNMTVSGYYVNGTQITSPNQDKLYDAAQEQGLIHLADYANTSGTNYNYWPSYPHLTFYANAQMQEFIAYHSDQSSNQSAIEADMQTYYDVDTTDNLLEDYPGAAAAYSVRKISRYSTTLCMRVREDSGNTETDIGFDSNGDLDTAAIAAHCGTANGYVVTWYDQSGSGNDVTQSNTSQQPKIYNGTAVITKNGQAAVYFSGNHPTQTGLVASGTPLSTSNRSRSAFSVVSLESDVSATVTGYAMFSVYVSVARMRTWSFRSSGNRSATSSGSVPLGAQHLRTDIADTTNITIYKDGSSFASAADDNSDWSLGYLQVGNGTGLGGGNADHHISEVIVYESDESSNRTAIESNIDTYYEVTTSFMAEFGGAAAAYSVRCLTAVGPAALCMKVRRDSDNATQNIGFDSNGDLDTAAIASFCGAANGYVDTWFDQSDNGHHATQSDTTRQPQIYNGSSVITENGRPALDGNGSSTLSTGRNYAATFSAYAVVHAPSDALGNVYSGTNERGLLQIVNFGSVYRILISSGTGLLTQPAGDAPDHNLVSLVYNGTSSTIHHQGSLVASGNAGTDSVTNMQLLSRGVFNPTTNLVSEIIFYESDHSANRTAVESNLNAYYSIF